MTDFSAWGYHASVTITGSTDGALTDYPVSITVSYQSFMNTDFSDIRFTLSDGTELSYSLESYTASSSADFLVQVPSLLASPSTTEIVIYAGNSSVTTTSDPSAVSETYDPLTGTSINTDIWSTLAPVGSVDESGSLNISIPSGSTGDWYVNVNKSPRVYTPVPDGDYSFTVKLDSYTVNVNTHAGLMVYLNATNVYIFGMYSTTTNGTWSGLNLEKLVSNGYTFNVLTVSGFSALPVWLRVTKTGTTYKFSYATATNPVDSDFTVLYTTTSLGFTPSYVGMFAKNWEGNAITAPFNYAKILKTTTNPPTTGTFGEWTLNSLIISASPVEGVLTVNTPQITIGGGILITAPPIGLTSSINIPTSRAIISSPPITAVSKVIPPVIAFLMEVKAGVTYNPDAINELELDGIPVNISFNVEIGGTKYE